MNRPLLISVLTLSLAAVGLTGCTSSRPAAEISLLSSSGFLKEWEAPLSLKRDPIKSLHVRNGLVVVYSQNNYGYFLNAGSGAVLGLDRITSPGYEPFPPIETASFVVIPTTSTVELFDKTGRRVNSFAAPYAIQSGGTSLGDSIFVGVARGSDSRMARYDLTADLLGQRWELYTTATLRSGPAALNDNVFIGGSDGKVWAVTSSRVPLWNTPENVFSTAGAITADLAIDEGALYVPSQDKKLYALDRTNGRIKWSYFAGLPLVEAPVVIGNNVYQLVPGRGLTALDKTDGKFSREPLWVQPQAEQVLAADEKYVYVRSGQSTILALDRATGVPAFQSARQDLIAFASNPQGSTIYAATRDGAVIAIRPVTRPGAVGEIVMGNTLILEPIALAD